MTNLLERNGELERSLRALGHTGGLLEDISSLVEWIYLAADALREDRDTAHRICDQLVVRHARLLEHRDRLTATMWVMQKARDWDKISPEADEFRRALIDAQLTIDRLTAQLASERDTVLQEVLAMLPTEPAPAHHSIYVREQRAELLGFAEHLRAMLTIPEMTNAEPRG